MAGVLTGFAVIGLLIVVGYVLSRTGIVPPQTRRALNDVAFYAASPALLFTVMARADVGEVFSGYLLGILLANLIVASIYLVVARTVLTRDRSALVMGATASVYANSNNMGLPIAVFVLGDPQYAAPLILLQTCVLMPAILLVLDLASTGRRISLRRVVTQPLRAPIVLASALGVLVTITGREVPRILWAPVDTLGGAAVPLMLIAFGISLHGQCVLEAGTGRRQVLLASALKVMALPAVAFLVTRVVLGLPPDLVFAATVICALPTAQNVYQFSLHHDAAPVLARDTVLITTFASFPVILLIAALLRS